MSGMEFRETAISMNPQRTLHTLANACTVTSRSNSIDHAAARLIQDKFTPSTEKKGNFTLVL